MFRSERGKGEGDISRSVRRDGNRRKSISRSVRGEGNGGDVSPVL